MQVKRLTIDGFRAFGFRQEFDLNAGAVLLVGSNGQGKTSFFDAILWSLAGMVPRLETKGDSPLVSRYSRSGEANVILEMDGADGPVSVSRWTNGTDERLILKEARGETSGNHAELRLLDLLWPGTSQSSDGPAKNVATAFTRSVYLQQDRLREFLEADSDSERFAAISELVGTTRVTDLQDALAKARTAWSKSLNQAKAEAEELAKEVGRLRAAIEEVGEEAVDTASVDSLWETWWKRAQALLRYVSIPQVSEVDAPAYLEGAIRTISVRQRELRTRADTAGRLATDLTKQLEEPAGAASELEESVRHLSEVKKAKEEALETASGHLKAVRDARQERLSDLVRSRDRRRRLNALSELALDLLTEQCPVCGQGIDPVAVHARLEQLLASEEDEDPAEGDNLTELEEVVATAQAELDELRETLARQESQLRFIRSKQDELGAELERLGLQEAEPSQDLIAEVRAVATETSQDLDLLAELSTEAEQLALAQARLAERSRLRELKRELAERTRELDLAQEDIGRRDRTSGVASGLVSHLEGVASELVSRRLQELSPMLQRIYSRMDPHPSFRDVSLVARSHYGKGRVTAEVQDRVEDLVVKEPHLVLSSSQSNILALSIFLSLNLGTKVPLAVTLLDDPVQSLDDVNLLGLTDLLRRLRAQRQMVLSTHDERLAALLARKMRPVTGEQKVRLFRFEGWSRRGPNIQVSDVEQGSGRLRVVA